MIKQILQVAEIAERLQKGEKVIVMCARSESKNRTAKMLIDYLKFHGMDESLAEKVEYNVAGHKDGMNNIPRFL